MKETSYNKKGTLDSQLSGPKLIGLPPKTLLILGGRFYFTSCITC